MSFSYKDGDTDHDPIIRALEWVVSISHLIVGIAEVKIQPMFVRTVQSHKIKLILMCFIPSVCSLTGIWVLACVGEKRVGAY